MPTIFVGNAAELVTVALPFVVVTVIDRAEPILVGLNGRFWRLYAAIVVVVADADNEQVRAIKNARIVFFIGISKMFLSAPATAKASNKPPAE